MERGLVWPNTAWLLGRSSPSDYILSRLAGVFFLLMFYLFTWVKLHDHSGSLKVSLGCLLGRYWDHPRNLARQEPWSEFLIEVFNYIRQMTNMNYMDHMHQTLQINNQLPIGTWLPMPTTGCTSWFWISSGQLGSWRPTRFSRTFDKSLEKIYFRCLTRARSRPSWRWSRRSWSTPWSPLCLSPSSLPAIQSGCPQLLIQCAHLIKRNVSFASLWSWAISILQHRVLGLHLPDGLVERGLRLHAGLGW